MGVIIFVISFFGCIGAFARNRCCLSCVSFKILVTKCFLFTLPVAFVSKKRLARTLASCFYFFVLFIFLLLANLGMSHISYVILKMIPINEQQIMNF